MRTLQLKLLIGASGSSRPCVTAPWVSCSAPRCFHFTQRSSGENQKQVVHWGKEKKAFSAVLCSSFLMWPRWSIQAVLPSTAARLAASFLVFFFSSSSFSGALKGSLQPLLSKKTLSNYRILQLTEKAPGLVCTYVGILKDACGTRGSIKGRGDFMIAERPFLIHCQHWKKNIINNNIRITNTSCTGLGGTYEAGSGRNDNLEPAAFIWAVTVSSVVSPHSGWLGWVRIKLALALAIWCYTVH